MVEQSRESPLVALLNEAVATDRAAFVDKLNVLGSIILHDGLLTGPPAPIGYYQLARLFEYFVLDASLPKPTDEGNSGRLPRRERRAAKQPPEDGSTRRERRRWKVVLDVYLELKDRVASEALPYVGVPNLRQFCDFESMKHGSLDNRLYAALLVLAAYMDEGGLFTGERYDRAMPADEHDLPRRIRQVVNEQLLGIGTGPAEPDAIGSGTGPGPSATRVPSAYLRVAFRESDAEHFDQYRRHYTHGERGLAHFVVYRPSRSSPTRLIKSFLSISAPAAQRHGDGEPDVCRFTHIYAPPMGSDGSTRRITLGRVLPLEHGVYLVGGQHNYLEDAESARERLAAKALKAMVLPWTKISTRDAILPLLAMSTNYDGFQLVTRAAMRATPIDMVENLEIGGVEVEGLLKDLLKDAALERRAVAEEEVFETARFQLCRPSEGEHAVRRAAKTILRLTNDTPHPQKGWEVAPGFANSRGATLTSERLRQHIASSFERNNRPLYSRATEEGAPQPFALLGGLRFGPLTQAD